MTDQPTVVPTTAMVRSKYANVLSTSLGFRRSEQWGRDFDRWLAAHDAEVAAKAKAEERSRIAEAIEQTPWEVAGDCAPIPPEDQAAWIRGANAGVEFGARIARGEAGA